MTLGQRIALATALVAACGGVLNYLLGGDDVTASSGGPPRFTSSAECKACHQDVFDEWEGSHHQIAYLNPEVRKLSDDFRNKECQACHLPRPVSETGYGSRVLPRLTHPAEGVSCLTCHLGRNGEILGRNAQPAAPCAPVASADLVSVEMCASCHNQHQTTDQWRASPQARDGVDCHACHMEHVERAGPGGAVRPGRRHVFPGAHDAAMLRSAARFSASVVGDELELALVNVTAGHNFPTEERHRAVDMVARFVLDDGSRTEWQRAWRFRQPYRDEPGENTQLPAGAEKRVRVPIPAGAVLAETRLWYRLTPFCGDDDPLSTLLESLEVALR
jgi:hypothetical protein